MEIDLRGPGDENLESLLAATALMWAVSNPQVLVRLLRCFDGLFHFLWIARVARLPKTWIRNRRLAASRASLVTRL